MRRRPASRWRSTRTCGTTSRSGRCKTLLDRGYLGEPVLATIDMRAIPHWMPWQQRQGWVTLRIMSIHHLDTFRYWFGDPVRVFASTRPDPRTAKFPHDDGICLYILEYANGLRASSWDDVWAGPARRAPRATSASAGGSKGPTAWPAARSAGPSYPERDAQHARLHDHRSGPATGIAALARGLVPRRLRRPDGRPARRPGRRPRAGDQRPRQPRRRWPWSSLPTGRRRSTGPSVSTRSSHSRKKIHRRDAEDAEKSSCQQSAMVQTQLCHLSLPISAVCSYFVSFRVPRGQNPISSLSRRLRR